MDSFNMKATLSFLLFLTTLVTSNNINSNDLITSMCQNTPYPSTCETHLRADPRSSKADSKSLILIMIDVIKSRFADSITFAKNMTQTIHDPDTIHGLLECISAFNAVVVADVESATYAVKTGNPKFALTAMVDAGNEVESCKQIFQGKEPSSLSDRTKELHEISAIAVAFVKTLF